MYKLKFLSLIILVALISCKAPLIFEHKNAQIIPATYDKKNDNTNMADLKWKDFFTDPYLQTLIDTALVNNVEILTTLQEIEMAKNNIAIKKSFLKPSVSAGVGLGIDKAGRYTATGAGNASTEITDGKGVPEPITDILLGLKTTWEVDIWHKLRNAKKGALLKYLKTVEGKNFVITNLVAEIANSYYELLALDNQLEIIRETIQLQKNELEIVKVQKEAAKATELGVKQFEAQVYNLQGDEYDVLQNITEAENKINFLLSRFPQKIDRDKTLLTSKIPMTINEGIPAQLLQNRPDIKQAALELQAAKIDVKIAQAEFYPSLGISANLGFQAFKPKYLFKPLESLAFSVINDFAGPIINRTAIKAEFNKANAVQLEALYDYQKAVVNGYIEVSNEMSNIKNLQEIQNLKTKEVQTLTKSISIAKDLFQYARATYLEVLIAQRDALSAKLELVETSKKQFNAVTNIYKALGGGWK